MFDGCKKLTKVGQIIAETLAEGCYANMFNGCTSLQTIASIPQCTTAKSCFMNMFSGCCDLLVAPSISSTTLAPSCYEGMFSGCGSLTQAPTLSAIELATSCYKNMFNGCTGLVSEIEGNEEYNNLFKDLLPATTLAESCYERMFLGCTSLTQAPDLLAMKLEDKCYAYMFYNCTSLNKIEVAFEAWQASALESWMEGVANAGIFVAFKLNKLVSEKRELTRGVNYIPSGWIIQDIHTYYGNNYYMGYNGVVGIVFDYNNYKFNGSSYDLLYSSLITNKNGVCYRLFYGDDYNVSFG